MECKVVREGEEEGEDHARSSQVQAGTKRLVTAGEEGMHYRHVPLHRQGNGHVDRHHHGGLKI